MTAPVLHPAEEYIGDVILADGDRPARIQALGLPPMRARESWTVGPDGRLVTPAGGWIGDPQ